LLDEGSLISDEVAAVDSLLLLGGPFRVVSSADWLNLGPDNNTRVVVFVLHLPATQPSSVIVSLVDSNNQSYDLPAEDVRAISGTDLTQIVFRLPNNLAVGVCSVRIKVPGQTTNAGVIRIRL
jgi:hypothetical protein